MDSDTFPTAPSDNQQDSPDFVTPYALSLNPSLIGKPLARPWKRAVAILIDLLLVAIISSLPWWLALLTLVTAVLYQRRKRGLLRLLPEKNRARLLRSIRATFVAVISVALLGVAAAVFVVFYLDGENPLFADTFEVRGVTFNQQQVQGHFVPLQIYLQVYDRGFDSVTCDDRQCWQEKLLELPVMLPRMGVSAEQTGALIDAYTAGLPLNEPVQQEVATYLKSQYGTDPMVLESVDTVTDQQVEPGPAEQSNYSLIAWVKGILQDLGLGFGWAALYFTVVPGLFNGRTLGKKLLGLRVVKLDDTPMTMWESFGRYGGYAAGITTGLLGYLQIYWDINRQAIQDKISETLVLDTRGKNQPALESPGTATEQRSENEY